MKGENASTPLSRHHSRQKSALFQPFFKQTTAAPKPRKRARQHPSNLDITGLEEILTTKNTNFRNHEDMRPSTTCWEIRGIHGNFNTSCEALSFGRGCAADFSGASLCPFCRFCPLFTALLRSVASTARRVFTSRRSLARCFARAHIRAPSASACS